MQKKKSIKLIFLVVTLILNSFSNIFAKSGNEHSKDMFAVLGLDYNSSQNYSVKKKLCDVINANIDDVKTTLKNFRVKLNNKFSFSYDLKHTHRLICHWSFDIDVKVNSYHIPVSSQYPYSLKTRFDSIAENITVVNPEKLWNQFLKYISTTQSNRNNTMIRAVKITLGINNSFSRDIAAILYSVHLLGDHSFHSGDDNSDVVKSVLEMDKIVNCINEHVKRIAEQYDKVRGRNCMDEYMQYEKALKKCNKTSDRLYADDVLKALEKHLPEIIFFQFGRKMSSHGLQFLEFIEEGEYLAA